jgi:hypothetical protein
VTANDQSINNSDKREIENKLKEYVSGIKTDFISNVSNSVKDLVLLQQNYIQYIRKANLVLSKTDGVMNSNNEPEIYDISGDTFTQLQTYLKKITDKHIEFFNTTGLVNTDECLYLNEDFYKKLSSTFIDNNTSGNFSTVSARSSNGLMSDDSANRFYQIMAHILNDENSKTELRSVILNSQNYSNIQFVTEVVDKAIKGCSDRFNPYTLINKTRYDAIKTNPRYLTLIKSPIEDNIKFGLKYTKVSGTSQQKNDIKDLYSSVNVNNKEKTFDGKVKFN